MTWYECSKDNIDYREKSIQFTNVTQTLSDVSSFDIPYNGIGSFCISITKPVQVTYTPAKTQREPMVLSDLPKYFCYNNLEEDLHVELSDKASVDIELMTFNPEGGLCQEVHGNIMSGNNYAIGFGKDGEEETSLKLNYYSDEWMQQYWVMLWTTIASGTLMIASIGVGIWMGLEFGWRQSFLFKRGQE